MLRRLLAVLIARLPPVDYDAIDRHLESVARATNRDSTASGGHHQPHA